MSKRLEKIMAPFVIVLTNRAQRYQTKAQILTVFTQFCSQVDGKKNRTLLTAKEEDVANLAPSSGWARNLTVDLDLCCCSARIRVACCLGEPPAAPDIWGAWRDEAYNESRMLFITSLASFFLNYCGRWSTGGFWPTIENGSEFQSPLGVIEIKKRGYWGWRQWQLFSHLPATRVGETVWDN